MSSDDRLDGGRKRLRDLASHLAAYVTVNELADYWMISRKQIYKQIEMGFLPAIRLGPRLLRIRTADALQFERQSSNLSIQDDSTLSVAQSRWTTLREFTRRARLTSAKIDVLNRV
jgi:excisionase family DNA binding protein